jgi:hypothetical protein
MISRVMLAGMAAAMLAAAASNTVDSLAAAAVFLAAAPSVTAASLAAVAGMPPSAPTAAPCTFFGFRLPSCCCCLNATTLSCRLAAARECRDAPSSCAAAICCSKMNTSTLALRLAPWDGRQSGLHTAMSGPLVRKHVPCQGTSGYNMHPSANASPCKGCCSLCDLLGSKERRMSTWQHRYK